MSTSGSISAKRLRSTDQKNSHEDLKTAATVAICPGAKPIHIEAVGHSTRSTSDHQPILTESKHLRNRDTRQSLSECPSQLTSLSRLEKSTTMEAIPRRNKVHSNQQRNSLNESFSKSPVRRRRSTSKRIRVRDKATIPEANHKVAGGPQEDRYLHTTTPTLSSDHCAPEVSVTWKRESSNASHSSFSSGVSVEQRRTSLTSGSSDDSASFQSFQKVSPALQAIEDPSFLDLPATNPKTNATNPEKNNTREESTFAAWQSKDAARAAESKQQPLAPTGRSPGSSNSSCNGKTPSRFHTAKADGSAETSRFRCTPPCPCQILSANLEIDHRDDHQEIHRAATAQSLTIPWAASCPAKLLSDPVKQGLDLRANKSRAVVSKLDTMLDTKKEISNKSAEDGDEVDLLPPSLEVLSSSPTSPCTPSEGQTTPEDYGTPLTSPCVSPAKSQSPTRDLLAFNLSLAQLDGGRDSADAASDSLFEESSELDDDEFPLEGPETVVDDDLRQSHRSIDLAEVDPETQPPNELDVAPEDATPLTRACRAKNPTSFPFPLQNTPRHQSSMLPAQRHPSRLLRFCEQNASPRQKRLMTGTLESPDRFIPGRTATPNKDALNLRKPAKKRVDPRRSAPAVELSDPFGLTASRSARMADRFATTRTPAAVHRPVSLSGTAVPDAVAHSRRAISSGAVWTVGGTRVTEGVASITNGRGGRVTSGTSAPHYTADFLRRQTPSDDEIQHGQRLAVAMEVQPGGRMIPRGSPFSTPSPDSPRRSSCSNIGSKRTVWSNNAWERSSPSTPSKPPKQKPKDIPVIPFRVLDAPALRDDYYCSLLAYSPTAKCLAVGLGPHVYLWSETRRTVPTHIPDSLTAPFGAHVTSVSFSSAEGGKSILAIGRADGRITLWSPQDRDPRFDSEQPSPVSCVSFRPTTVSRPSVREPSMTVATEELLVGDEVGNVYYYSIEWPSPDDRDLFGWHGSMTLLARISCHTQQICGIAWSKDGDLFATGGNDNQLLLFETKKLFAKGRNGSAAAVPSAVRVRNGSSSGSESVAGQGSVMAIKPGQQKHLFTLNAAVKAIAFAPWQPSLLAAGGGSNDRCIHFFHALSGATLATIDCHAQVTSLVWSEHRKEIAATFGFAQPDHPYRVAVFSWPSCQRVVGIPWWSEERALYAVAYPGRPSGGPSEQDKKAVSHGRRTRDEGCLVIATSDASIKFHEIWPEKSGRGRREGAGGLLGGSMILEDGVSFEVEREVAIR